jgi:threonine aldolase
VRRIPGDGGRLDVPQLDGQIRDGNVHFAPTRLVCLENTTNLGGGRTYPLEQIARIGAWARAHELAVHLDGARLFNACVARGYAPRDVARHVDSVSICFSKGLGCPMGSILVGSAQLIARARRARKLFGGALRQAGVPAAACLYALDHHVDRLADDHRHARLFAEEIAAIPGVCIDLPAIETNLVFFEIDPARGTAAELSSRLLDRGVRINPAGGTQRLRACTHLDVDEAGVLAAARAIRDCLTSSVRGTQRAAERMSEYAKG